MKVGNKVSYIYFKIAGHMPESQFHKLHQLAIFSWQSDKVVGPKYKHNKEKWNKTTTHQKGTEMLKARIFQ